MDSSSLTVRVHRKHTEAVDICSFELVNFDGKPLPNFSAGSHIDVYLPNGISRQYSLCNDPAETHRYLIGVLRDPCTRGGSGAMHELVHEGDTLKISVPKNHFPLVRGAQRSLLLAGGIGITPILCMAERLDLAGEDFELHYSARSRERMAFHDRIRQSSFSSKAVFYFDNNDGAEKLDLGKLLGGPSAGTHLYVCGPKGFMDAVLETSRAKGWPEDHLHYEFFSGQPIKSDGDGSFHVKLASSGKVVLVPKDKTVVQALNDAEVEVQTSCEQGVCGTCLTRVLQGVPDHRDMYLTPDEQAMNDRFLPCCSRAKSPLLVLDI
nr:PDR/VanB family oxidoreductase [uncultured Cupriavidus sp.]